MSVIEFLTTYWDWYLLVGFLISVAWAVDREERGFTLIALMVVIVFVWPLSVTRLLFD